MTTLTNGLLKGSTLRAFTETFQDRRAWLVQKMAEKMEARPDFDPMGSFELAEIRAIDHALALMDAEWDNLVRLQRNVARTEGRNIGLERHLEKTGEEFDPKMALAQKPPHWEPPNPG